MTPVAFQRLESGFVLAATIVAYRATGSSWALFALLILTPDLFMLGYARNARLGAVVYNLGHSYFMPVAVLGLWWFGDLEPTLAIGLIWAAHIAMDRLFGYGLKLASGFKDTHLGRLG